MSALTTLEMDLDCNKWKKRSVSLRSHSLQIEKKKRSFEKIFSLERSGGSSHHLNQSKNIFSIEWSRARFASKRTKKRARCSSFYTRRLGSLSRAREREIRVYAYRMKNSARASSFFLTQSARAIIRSRRYSLIDWDDGCSHQSARERKSFQTISFFFRFATSGS